MQYQPEFAFILPLDEDEKPPEEPAFSDDETTKSLTEIGIPKTTKRKHAKIQLEQPSIDTVASKPKNNFSFIWYVIRWYILSYVVILSSFYSIFHFALDNEQKDDILKALAFCDDWKQLIFFFGLYVSFAVKKVSDVSSNIPPTDKIANLLSIASKNHRTQKAVIKYVCTAIAMIFSCLSPMVRKRLLCSENKIKANLEAHSRRIIENIEKKLLGVSSSHFMPLKWSLHVINEARDKKDLDDRLANILINEISALHAQCDRLVVLKHDTFSRRLTIGATTSVYCYFVVGAIRQIWIGLTEYHSNYYIISVSAIIHFVVFLCFLMVLRFSEQIIRPYSDDHDVFELNRILNEKLEVASFVLDKEYDLRKRMSNHVLLP